MNLIHGDMPHLAYHLFVKGGLNVYKTEEAHITFALYSDDLNHHPRND